MRFTKMGGKDYFNRKGYNGQKGPDVVPGKDGER